jgi:hypothetical protein
MTNVITVEHVTGGLLEQAEPPAWVGTQPGNVIEVKGKNYWVVAVAGDLENGPRAIKVR